MIDERLSKIDSCEMEKIYKEVQKFEETGGLENGVLRAIFDEEGITAPHLGTLVLYQELSKRWYEERKRVMELEKRVEELQFIVDNESVDMRGYRM